MDSELALTDMLLRLVAAAGLGGIGFLGAGSIARSGDTIQGITTGAAIGLSGAIGVACATGNIVLTAMVTGLAAAIVVGLGFAEPAPGPVDTSRDRRGRPG